jgi:hypothetical protein
MLSPTPGQEGRTTYKEEAIIIDRTTQIFKETEQGLHTYRSVEQRCPAENDFQRGIVLSTKVKEATNKESRWTVSRNIDRRRTSTKLTWRPFRIKKKLDLGNYELTQSHYITPQNKNKNTHTE